MKTEGKYRIITLRNTLVMKVRKVVRKVVEGSMALFYFLALLSDP